VTGLPAEVESAADAGINSSFGEPAGEKVGVEQRLPDDRAWKVV
jgi:hypothetical protein